MFKITWFLLVSAIAISRAIDTTTEKSKIVNDVIAKRDLVPEKVLSKSYDPPPEYYRGPGSTFERDRNKDDTVVGLHHSFTTAPYDHDRKYSIQEGNRNGYYGINRRPNPDRISVGHYGPSGSGHPSGQIPYGQPQPIDISNNYGSTGNDFEKYYPPGHYLPEHPVGFDLYSNGYSDYGHSPEYNYHSKAELAKSFLIPLAGAAILGITAALIANPLLLQLGTVSAGKRRRRDVNAAEMKSNGKSKAHDLAYRAYLHN